MPNDPAFMPNPWVMGVVMVGVGLVLWWLAPDLVRPPRQPFSWDREDEAPTRESGWERALRAISVPRGVALALTRLVALVSSGLGVAVLAVTATA